MSLLSIFAAARESPKRVGLITATAQYTFADLAALSSDRANTLYRFPAPLLLQPSIDLESMLWLYAASAMGTTFLALHTRATAGEQAAVTALAGARSAPTLGEEATDSRAEPSDRPVSHPDQAYCLMQTSGSSGSPKLVELSRRAVLASAAASQSNLGLLDDERWLLCLPLAHVAGLSILVRMLAARRMVVLFDPGEAGLLARAADLGRQMHEHRVTLVSLVPSVLERLLREGVRPPRSLRAVLVGGAGCSEEMAVRARRAGFPILTSYGLTETGSQIVARRYSERDLPLPARSGCVSSGHPLPGVELKLVGETIALKTPALFSGYFGRTATPLDAEGWFITSDRGLIGPEGELYVLGRTDTMIVTGGEKVSPEEVERVLRKIPAIREACVFGVPCAEFGSSIVAVVTAATSGPEIDLELLFAQLGEELARFKLPRAFALAKVLPVTASGKLDRQACRDRFGPGLVSILAARGGHAAKGQVP